MGHPGTQFIKQLQSGVYESWLLIEVDPLNRLHVEILENKVDWSEHPSIHNAEANFEDAALTDLGDPEVGTEGASPTRNGAVSRAVSPMPSPLATERWDPNAGFERLKSIPGGSTSPPAPGPRPSSCSGRTRFGGAGPTSPPGPRTRSEVRPRDGFGKPVGLPGYGGIARKTPAAPCRK